MKKAILLLGLLGLASGCTSYTVTQFEDHPTRPITRLEAFKHTNYFLYETAEHQFYLCSQTPTKLACNRACGGNTDIQCPTAAASGAAVSTNVR
jgi:hypothetical protein